MAEPEFYFISHTLNQHFVLSPGQVLSTALGLEDIPVTKSEVALASIKDLVLETYKFKNAFR